MGVIQCFKLASSIYYGPYHPRCLAVESHHLFIYLSPGFAGLTLGSTSSIS